MADDIPQWAKDKAGALSKAEGAFAGYYEGCQSCIAFARYIAAHEEQPVDPLLVEAREIWARARDAVDSTAIAEAYRDGSYDRNEGVIIALAALKRGIELAKSGAAQ